MCYGLNLFSKKSHEFTGTPGQKTSKIINIHGPLWVFLKIYLLFILNDDIESSQRGYTDQISVETPVVFTTNEKFAT
jgi:hypothetical protein